MSHAIGTSIGGVGNGAVDHSRDYGAGVGDELVGALDQLIDTEAFLEEGA